MAGLSLLPGPDALRLGVGILAALVLGTVTGWLLKHLVARRQPHAVIDNVIDRVRSWWVIAILVGVALLAGPAGVCLLFALTSFLALREFVPRVAERPGDRAMVLGAFWLALPAQYLLVWQGDTEWLTLLVPAYAFIVAPVIAVLAGDPRDLLVRVAPLQWGLMLCVQGVSFVPALLALKIPGHAGAMGYLLMYLLLVTQLGDVFQYLWGKLAGRHALAPAVSPSKTVEGLVGGVLSSTFLGAGLAWITPFGLAESAAMALVVSLFGVMGGLVLSAIKRDRGVKDWGALIPGHGGVLDRLDSLCLSAPVFYSLVRFGWAS